ncbi:MAG: response regulator transcription factor [Oscillatoriales cyanobacterium C42_A2020_001]|nr:response regulator transcription factor [Leptolyngbyaceae cyanobacterium C42_A2020_001]
MTRSPVQLQNLANLNDKNLKLPQSPYLFPIDATFISGSSDFYSKVHYIFEAAKQNAPVRCEVLQDGKLIPLTALEFRLLHFMAQQPGRVWTRPELLKGVWGYECLDDGRVVDVHIGQIRGKLEADRSAPKLIRTIRGMGYCFEARTVFRKVG